MSDGSEPATWMIVTGIIGGLGLIFLLGVGCGQQWGAAQWGPLASWLSGALTLAAVVVALRQAGLARRESIRSQRAREIDHEISRRRECIQALGDLWGTLLGMGGPVDAFVIYLEGLALESKPKERTDAEQIAERIHESWSRLTSPVRSQLFTARLVLKGTPLYDPVARLYQEISNFHGELVDAISQVIGEGRRPDADRILGMWHDLSGRELEHSQLAVQHFSLDRDDVDRYLRQTRQ